MPDALLDGTASPTYGSRGVRRPAQATQDRAGARRNLATDRVDGEILGFLDDDARVLEDWLDVARTELTGDRAAGCCRSNRGRSAGPGATNEAVVGFLAGGNSLVRRAALPAAGGCSDQRPAADKRPGGKAGNHRRQRLVPQGLHVREIDGQQRVEHSSLALGQRPCLHVEIIPSAPGGQHPQLPR